MKALLSVDPGGPLTLIFAEIAQPIPGPGQVLIKVASVSLNFPDALLIEDLYQFKPPRPFAPGGEVAGVIAAIADDVTTLKIGDRVCALCGHGGLAEFIAVDATRTFVIPPLMPFEIGATLMMTYGTTYHGLLDRAGLQAGETLLVLGAAGGVGSSAVELGKALGAQVIAAVSSPEKAEMVKRLGADDVIIYPRPPLDQAGSKALASQFKAACPGGYDVVFDPIGGEYAEPAIRAMGWEGRYAVVGFTAGIPSIAANLILLKACSVIGIFWGAWLLRHPDRFANEMAILFQLWEDKKIAPEITLHFAFDDAREAITHLRGRTALGKLVVNLWDGAS